MTMGYAELMMEKVAVEERCVHLRHDIEVVRKQRDSWVDTAYERMLLLQEARDFVIAYMKQCDVPCGIEGAEVLLGKINQTTADLRSNAPHERSAEGRPLDAVVGRQRNDGEQ